MFCYRHATIDANPARVNDHSKSVRLHGHCAVFNSFFVLVSALFSVTYIADVHAAVDEYKKRTLSVDSNTSDWLLRGRNYAEQNFSPLNQINDGNVAKLGLLWSLDIPSKDGLSATPIVVDGVAYLSSPFSKVHAIDIRSGKLVWSYDPKVKLGSSFSSTWSALRNRGAAYWDGMVYVGTADCRLVAIDSKTGALKWEVQACDPSKENGIAGAPMVANGKVYIGNGVSDFGARGYLASFDAYNGKEVWRFYTVPDDPAKGPQSKALEIASKTWKDGWAKNGGGAPWGAIVYDPEMNSVYFGTNAAAPIHAGVRNPTGLENLYANSIVSVDADTGEYKWHYQVVPNDAWDYDATMHIMLGEVEVDNKKRKVLMQAPKSGFFYVIDRESGKLISADNYVPVSWASHYDLETGKPVEKEGARYYKNKDGAATVSPGVWGARNWMSMSTNPSTGLVYFSAWNLSTRFAADPNAMLGGVLAENYAAGTDPATIKSRGSLIAWDPVQRTARWKVPQDYPINGSTLSTGGNLVFHGTATGKINAYRADNGQMLWTQATGSGVLAAPITVTVGDQQILLVTVGSPALVRSAMVAYGVSRESRGPSRIMAFALGGAGKIPKVDTSLPKIDEPPKIEASKATLQSGANLYNSGSCWLCHGDRADSIGGSAPDLRRSPIIKSKDAWFSVVVKGALKGGGMLGQDFSPDDAEAIRAFVVEQAWKEYRQVKSEEKRK
ncbi:PQQ-dependent dehydrogenase, methanol/ethanol family [Stutzerimonas stutzeri]|uniref:PQQ-dependent dehydrogenase, methanol/ethanol family n=1 Tax=Stutzerimonas stutzeri TaxID=316 RepID=UPI0037D57621